MSFWVPLLMAMDDGFAEAVVIVVTPLNYLGTQNSDQLALSGVPAVALEAKTACASTFKVCPISSVGLVLMVLLGYQKWTVPCRNVEPRDLAWEQRRAAAVTGRTFRHADCRVHLRRGPLHLTVEILPDGLRKAR